MSGKRVLLTGATGFLGSNLAKTLIKQGYEVSIIKRSTSNMFRLKDVLGQFETFDLGAVSIEQCLQEARADIVIHCATDYGRKQVEPSAIIEANLILPLKLLELSRRNGVKCFINTDTFLDKGINYYSLSKKQFKDWLDTFSTELVCVNVTLEHFYGPLDDKTKFVSFVIEKLLTNASEIALTEGNQKRDFIFIDDVIAAFLTIISRVGSMPNGSYEFGVGTNNMIAIKELVELIREVTGNTFTRLNFGAIPYRKNEIMASNIDTTAIRALGWATKYSLIEGLQCTIEAEKEISE